MIQIKHRYTRAVIFEHGGPAIKDAVVAAVQARAAFARAYLAGADLARANLAGAYLEGAYYDPSKHSEPKERERCRLARELEASRAEVARLRRALEGARKDMIEADLDISQVDAALNSTWRVRA